MNCIYCKYPAIGGICTHDGYSCTKCLIDEHKKLKNNWKELKQWVKSKKINFSGEDRFWRGYDDFHGDVRAKIKEIEQKITSGEVDE